MSTQAPGVGAGCRGREILRLPRLTILFPPPSAAHNSIPSPFLALSPHPGRSPSVLAWPYLPRPLMRSQYSLSGFLPKRTWEHLLSVEI